VVAETANRAMARTAVRAKNFSREVSRRLLTECARVPCADSRARLMRLVEGVTTYGRLVSNLVRKTA
jgi:hypothetical protein